MKAATIPAALDVEPETEIPVHAPLSQMVQLLPLFLYAQLDITSFFLSVFLDVF